MNFIEISIFLNVNMKLLIEMVYKKCVIDEFIYEM